MGYGRDRAPVEGTVRDASPPESPGAANRNIVLIGMPGSGKTTLGPLLAAALGRAYRDSDDAIREAEGMSIPEIFAQKGEAHFRRVETRCLEALMAGTNAVISVGGGAVLENEALLKRNATVLYLRRSIERILETLTSAQPGARPLARGAEDLERLQAQRQGIYARMADAVIDNDGPIEATLAQALAACAGLARAEGPCAKQTGDGGAM